MSIGLGLGLGLMRRKRKRNKVITVPCPRIGEYVSSPPAGLYFEVVNRLRLISFNLYAENVGVGGNFELSDNAGNVLHTFPFVSGNAGVNSIDFGVVLEPGFYKMYNTALFSGGGLLRSPAWRVSYPYLSEDLRVVRGGISPYFNDGYYYWFYRLSYRKV